MEVNTGVIEASAVVNVSILTKYIDTLLTNTAPTFLIGSQDGKVVTDIGYWILDIMIMLRA